MNSRPANRWIAMLLSAALIAAPLATGAAPKPQAAAPAQTANAHAHHDAVAHDAAQTAAPNDLAGACEQHQSCLGQCCAACAHCVAAALGVPAVSRSFIPALIPFVSRLDGRLASAPPGPPPRG